MEIFAVEKTLRKIQRFLAISSLTLVVFYTDNFMRFLQNFVEELLSSRNSTIFVRTFRNFLWEPCENRLFSRIDRVLLLWEPCENRLFSRIDTLILLWETCENSLFSRRDRVLLLWEPCENRLLLISKITNQKITESLLTLFCGHNYLHSSNSHWKNHHCKKNS